MASCLVYCATSPFSEGRQKIFEGLSIHLKTYNVILLFLGSVCFTARQAPPEKGSTLKEKNLLPWGANSFLLEQTPFQKGGNTSLYRVVI